MSHRRVGIMGGTFNPIHIGHLILAECARTRYDLDEICFIPSGQSYMKKDMKIPDKAIRAEMTKLAIEGNPFFSFSDIEMRREGNTYTYETLEILTSENKDTEYFFIVGADSLWNIEKWRYPERIFANCKVLVAVRDDISQEELLKQCKYLEAKYHTIIQTIPIESIGISSTMIRERIKTGMSIRYLVPKKVREYIETKNIYF